MLSSLLALPGWNLQWWQYVLITLALTHISIAAITIFLHRSQAHRAVDLHPIVSHFFRLWLWLTSGVVTKEWVSIHRKHHAKCETVEDPHSPQTRGIMKVLLEGAELYRAEAKVAATLEKYGHGTPDDWMERNVYSRHSAMGVALLMIINIALFGPIGLTIWAVQMAWMPIMAAGIINGVGHYWGYRNFACEDASTNIVPWGILIAAKNCTTTTTRMARRHGCRTNGTSSTSAGCTSTDDLCGACHGSQSGSDREMATRQAAV